jgi:YD repeat-containing protein
MLRDGLSGTTYGYDEAGRLTSQVRGTTTVGYAFDLAGRVTTLTYPGYLPGDRNLVRSYDDANRLTAVTDWANRTTSLGWDADNNLDTITFPNGVTTAQMHDDADQTTRIHTTAGTVTLLDHQVDLRR